MILERAEKFTSEGSGWVRQDFKKMCPKKVLQAIRYTVILILEFGIGCIVWSAAKVEIKREMIHGSGGAVRAS